MVCMIILLIEFLNGAFTLQIENEISFVESVLMKRNAKKGNNIKLFIGHESSVGMFSTKLEIF